MHDFDIGTGGPMFAYSDLEIETECDPRINQDRCLPDGHLDSGPKRDPKPFFVNLETGETTRKDPGVPLLENGSILSGFLIA